VIGEMRIADVVQSGRGRLVIRDEAGLRALSCRCAETIEAHFDKVLHGIYPTR
jgi:hypothetical protein